MKCRSRKRIVALHVETYSCVADRVTCKLRPGDSVMCHYVHVENLYAWDAEIHFQGVIANIPPIIRFDAQPPQVHDDAAHWHATVVVPDGQDAVIQHVALLPVVSAAAGQANIILKLEIIWSNLGDPWPQTLPGRGSLSICVTR